MQKPSIAAMTGFFDISSASQTGASGGSSRTLLGGLDLQRLIQIGARGKNIRCRRLITPRQPPSIAAIAASTRS